LLLHYVMMLEVILAFGKHTEMVVNTALQERYEDAIGVSILSGAHNTIFPKNTRAAKAKEIK